MTTWSEAIARQIDIKAIIATTLSYFYIPRWFTYQLLGASRYMVHKTRVRDGMRRELWFKVMNHYNWTCARCGKQNYQNKEPDKPKMQVDHITPVYRWGNDDWNNLQVLCEPHNKAKGTRVIDYRGMAAK